MKSFLCVVFILLLTSQVNAEIYSWIDDNGTYNYTEDYSRVPKKYQKKVKRREDAPQDVKSQVSPNTVTQPKQADKTDAKPAEPAGEKELYGGKTREEWRKEMAAREAELSSIQQHIEQVRKQILEKGIYKEQFEVLQKDYNDSRASYDLKYKSYAELIETIRKAGLTVEIKK